ncbi:DUF2177 family protein [Piscinibacter sakaiensis]|uniref:DUF2177 family protein n=1 Tax=Piscinibacter sakaiensis TaxID=1547922 RepID=UPI003AAB12B8
MKRLAIAYGVGVLLLALLDALWLGIVAADFYQSRLAHLMAESPRLDAALAFYLMYPAGVLLFAVRPALAAGGAARAAWLGAALGFFAYATYDLTNLATLRDWPLPIVFVDIAWGSAITAAIAWATCRAAARLGDKAPR